MNATTVTASEAAAIARAVARVKRVRAGGDGFASFDVAHKALRRHPASLVLAYHAVLLAARIGALSEATWLYRHYDIAGRVERGETDPVVPLEDLLALSARLDKDRALEDVGPDRDAKLAAAARSYLAVFDRTGGYYPLVNAASLYALAGEADAAARCARRTLALLAEPAPGIDPAEQSWRLLSALEARLVLEQWDAARAAAHAAAASFHGDYGDLSTTIRQLDRLVAAKGAAFDVAAELGMPGVICYADQSVAAHLGQAGLSREQEREIAAAVDRFLDGAKIRWCFGSLSAGAEILIAEAMHRRGVSTHVVLPFAEAEFIEVAVRPFGEEWVRRFARCRARAASCRSAADGGYFHDDALFEACDAYALGLARLQSAQLGAALTRLLVRDESGERLPPGSSDPTHVIAVPVARGKMVATSNVPTRRRRPSAMLFADVVGFSRIGEDALPQFHADIMVPMAASIAALPKAARIVETWGDAVFLVYDDVEAAADGAVMLVRALRAENRPPTSLPSHLDLRVSGHFGSVFEIVNPFTRQPACLGTHVSRAARIEPVTPPGVVYVSEAFAVQLALLEHSRHRADFVGATKLAKKFGELPVFRLISRPVCRATSEGSTGPGSGFASR